MDQTAIIQVGQRMGILQEEYNNLLNANDFVQADQAWCSFLSVTGTIFSKLEQGSKNNAESKAWFEKKKLERKNDPLLKYLHLARNADEHGIERITEWSRGSYLIEGKELPFGKRVPLWISKVDQHSMQPIGEPIEVAAIGPEIKLVRIHNKRDRDFCDPPDSHLGHPLTFPCHAKDTAEAALKYFDALVKEAMSLAGLR